MAGEKLTSLGRKAAHLITNDRYDEGAELGLVQNNPEVQKQSRDLLVADEGIRPLP